MISRHKLLPDCQPARLTVSWMTAVSGLSEYQVPALHCSLVELEVFAVLFARVDSLLVLENVWQAGPASAYTSNWIAIHWEALLFTCRVAD